MNLKRVGLDTSKAVLTLPGVAQDEKAVLRRNVRRAEMEAFFAQLPPTLVAWEACGGSHHWGRRLAALGHTVRLIPPQYVKPFVRRGKDDRNDAIAKRSVSEGAASGAGRGAISEAASRPDMPGAPVKSAERQAEAIVLSAREWLARQRTPLVNAVRGHAGPRGPPDAAEFGVVAAPRSAPPTAASQTDRESDGASPLPMLLEAVAAEEAVPTTAKGMLAFLGAQVAQLDGQIAELERGMERVHKANAMSKALAQAPGIGPIGALSLTLTIDPGRFASGRHFAAIA